MSKLKTLHRSKTHKTTLELESYFQPKLREPNRVIYSQEILNYAEAPAYIKRTVEERQQQNSIIGKLANHLETSTIPTI